MREGRKHGVCLKHTWPHDRERLQRRGDEREHLGERIGISSAPLHTAESGKYYIPWRDEDAEHLHGRQRRVRLECCAAPGKDADPLSVREETGPIGPHDIVFKFLEHTAS